MVKESQEVSVRLYHEDTLDSQNRFRKWLELLIKNKGIIPPQQRDTFFTSLSKSTFEIGRGQYVDYLAKNGTRIKLGTFYSFTQRMAYQTNDIIKVQYPPRIGKIYEIPIEELWKVVLKHFLKIRPYALEEARRLSAERFRTQAKGDSVEFFPSVRTHRKEE